MAGKHLQEEQAKKRLEELKKEEQKNKIEIKDTEIEKARLEAFKQINEIWDYEVAQYYKKGQRVKEQDLQRHEKKR